MRLSFYKDEWESKEIPFTDKTYAEIFPERANILAPKKKQTRGDVMTLLPVSFFYLIAGSAVFIRRKLGVEQKDADYVSYVLFYTGVSFFILGVFECIFPSPFWGIPLVIGLLLMVRLVIKRTTAILNNQNEHDS